MTENDGNAPSVIFPSFFIVVFFCFLLIFAAKLFIIMKKPLIILSIIFIVNTFAIPISVFADDPIETIILDKQPKEKDPNNRPGNNPDGNRMPPRPILCTISIEHGIECEIAAEETLSYEIRTEDGICLASFTDESDFIQMLFSVPGNYQIRFLTDDYIYTGYIAVKDF